MGARRLACVGWLHYGPAVELPYAERGDRDGVPVVLLHGYVESWRSFELVLNRLPDWIHAFAPTLRGHPGAEEPESGYALADYNDDVTQFMDAIGVGAAVFVGGSSGGYIAQRLALDHPERVAGLVLSGCPRSLRETPPILDAVFALEDPVDRDFVREFVASTVSDHVDGPFLERMVDDSCAVPAHVWKAALIGLIEAEPPTETGTIGAPTVVLWGEEDAFLPRTEQEALVAAIPGARLVTFPGTGHIVHWERPAEVADAIVELARTSAA